MLRQKLCTVILILVTCRAYLYPLRETYEDKIIKYFELGEFIAANELVSSYVKDYNKLLYFQAVEKFYRAKYKESYNILNELISREGIKKDERYKNFYDYISLMTKIAEKFNPTESKHIIFNVTENDAVLTHYAIEYMDYIYPILNEKFGITPQEKIVIEVYPDVDTFSIASTLTKDEITTSGAVGICKFNRIMILSPAISPFGYHWIDTLAHEYIHYLINKVSGFNTPLWLNEGIARYYDTYWREKKSLYLTPDVENTLNEIVNDEKFIPFSRMVPSLAKLNSQEEVNIAFAEVSNVVDYIITQYGEDTVFTLLSSLKTEKDKAFEKILNKTESEIETDWQTWAKTKQFSKYTGIIKRKIEFDKTVDEISSFIPLNEQKYIQLGDSYRKRNNYKTALLEYKKALKRKPYNSLILTKIGITLLALGRINEAKEKFHLAIKTYTAYTAPYLYLAKIYIAERKIDTAIKYLKDAICINPYNPEIHKILGYCYYNIDKLEEAKNEWEIVLLLTPDDLEARSFINQIKE